jgi:hypothetical protein
MRKVCASLVMSFLLIPALLHSVLSAEPIESKVVHFPIMFEKNLGQVSSSYLFMSRHRNVEALFSRAGVDIFVPEGKGCAQIRLRFTGLRPNVAPEGNDPFRVSRTLYRAMIPRGGFVAFLPTPRSSITRSIPALT